MWIYHQHTGELMHGSESVATGYSGHGDGLDNPALEGVSQVGPIPEGCYTIGDPFHHLHCGPLALPLIPDDSNEMYGRCGFLIHGDNRRCDHSASEGCIILSRDIREMIAESGDHRLEVRA